MKRRYNKVFCALVLIASVVICTSWRGYVWGSPVGSSVVAGAANIENPTANTVLVNQYSDRVIINWEDFSINAGELTQFIQPSSSSIALNRVITGNPSSLYGQLLANGEIILINPNGVIVGPSGQINTSSFVASTFDIGNTDFLSGGDMHFLGDSIAAVQNLGSIEALGGDVFLIAHSVHNEGTIKAANGAVGLAAGAEILLVESGHERLTVLAGNLNAIEIAAGVENAGQIEASKAELKAVGGNIYALAINNSGIVRATSVETQGGTVVLRSDGGRVNHSGVIDTSSIDGFGGEVRILGSAIALVEDAVVDASGDLSGGRVWIGGGPEGKAKGVENAEWVYAGAETTIDASAISNGDGGEIVVFGQKGAFVHGQIEAQGGTYGGTGGFVETSGKQRLEVGSAPVVGTGGEWLIDPVSISIIAGSSFANINTSNPFLSFEEVGDPGPATLGVDLILAALTGGATVTISTGDDIVTGTDPGNISLDTGLDFNGTGSNTLSLQAGNNVILNQPIFDSAPGDDSLNISLSAGINPGLSSLTQSVQVNSSMATGGGTFLSSGLSFSGNGNIDAGAGNITISHVGSVTLPAITTTGDLTVTTSSTISQSGAIQANDFIAKTMNDAGASITLTDFGNNTASVDLRVRNTSDTSAAGASISYFDTDVLDVAFAETTGTVTLETTGSITESGIILADTVIAKTLNDAGGGISLGNPGNEVQHIDLRVRNLTDTANTGGDIDYNDATGFNVLRLQTARNINLFAREAMTQSGAIEGDLLIAKTLNDAGAAITFDHLANDVASIILQVRDSIDSQDPLPDAPIVFRDATGVDVIVAEAGSTVTITAGGDITDSGALKGTDLTIKTLNDAGADITLDSFIEFNSFDIQTRNSTDTADAAGSIFLNEFSAVDIAAVRTAADATIVAGGAVTESGLIVAPNFAVKTLNDSGALISLGNPLQQNVVGTISLQVRNAADDSVAAADITYIDSTGFVVSIAQSASQVTLIGGEAILQSGGIQADTLVVKTVNDAGASITLDHLANETSRVILQARNVADDQNAAGTISYRDATGIDVVVAQSTSTVDLVGGGTIRDGDNGGAIQASALTIKTLDDAGSSIEIDASNGFFVEVGSIDLQVRNSADTADVPGSITFNNFSGFDIAVVRTLGDAMITSGGSISQSGPLSIVGNSTFTVTAANSDVLLGNFGNTLAGVTFAESGGGTVRDIDLRNDSGTAAFPLLPTGIRDLTLSFPNTSIDLVAITLTGNLSANAGGAITDSGDLVVPGIATLNAGSGNNITLDSAGNDFGTVTVVAGNNVTVVDANGVDFGASTISGILNVDVGGTITQSDVLNVSGASIFTLRTNPADILLGSFNNAFADVTITETSGGGIQDLVLRNVSPTAAVPILPSVLDNLTLIYDNAAIVLPATTLIGNLSVTAGGNITQSGPLSVDEVGQTATFTAGGNSITLNNAGNDFGNIVINSGNNVVLRDVDALTLGASVVSGNLSLTTDGAITQTGNIIANGSGAVATIVAGPANNITLNDSANDFTTVAIGSGNDVEICDINGVDLGASTISGDLTVCANGNITQNGAISVNSAGSTVTLSTGGTTDDVILPNIANDFDTVIVVPNEANNVSLADVNSLSLSLDVLGVLTVNLPNGVLTRLNPFAAAGGENITENNNGGNGDNGGESFNLNAVALISDIGRIDLSAPHLVAVSFEEPEITIDPWSIREMVWMSSLEFPIPKKEEKRLLKTL